HSKHTSDTSNLLALVDRPHNNSWPSLDNPHANSEIASTTTAQKSAAAENKQERLENPPPLLCWAPEASTVFAVDKLRILIGLSFCRVRAYPNSSVSATSSSAAPRHCPTQSGPKLRASRPRAACRSHPLC